MRESVGKGDCIHSQSLTRGSVAMSTENMGGRRQKRGEGREGRREREGWRVGRRG